MHRLRFSLALLAAVASAACNDRAPVDQINAPAKFTALTSATTAPTVNSVVNVTRDTTAQNETPLAVNPINSQNLLTGNNDWNYNDGCGVNASFNGGKTWTKTLPSGFIPGITRYTNDPDVPGTGDGDFGGDPAAAFGPDGTAYFACFDYNGTSTTLLLSRSTDGGATWQAGGVADPLTLVSAFNGQGISKGSNGQFPDHDAMFVGADGTIYVTWAQFHGWLRLAGVDLNVARWRPLFLPACEGIERQCSKRSGRSHRHQRRRERRVRNLRQRNPGREGHVDVREQVD